MLFALPNKAKTPLFLSTITVQEVTLIVIGIGGRQRRSHRYRCPPYWRPYLSAKEIIGNESQERMGLIISAKDTPLF